MNPYGVVTEPGTLRIERLLPGPIERVWSYLTDSKKRGEWLSSGEIELKPGGRVQHVFNNSKLTGQDDPAPTKYAQYAGDVRMGGTVTAVDPPRLLSYTWGDDGGADAGSEVTFELTPRGQQVLLVLTHRRLGDRKGLLSVSAGWHTHLDILVDRLEGRAPQKFWATHMRLEGEYEKRLPPA